jgi:hypothetical protein
LDATVFARDFQRWFPSLPSAVDPAMSEAEG